MVRRFEISTVYKMTHTRHVPDLGKLPHGLKIAPFEKKSSLHNNGYLPDTVAKLRGGLLLTTSYIMDYPAIALAVQKFYGNKRSLILCWSYIIHYNNRTKRSEWKNL